MLGPRVQLYIKTTKIKFFVEQTFFAKSKDRITTVGSGLLRGIQCKAILCVLSRGSFIFAICTHSDFVVLLYVSLTPRSPGTPFLLLFLEGFWARACKDLLQPLTQERFCLQRQKMCPKETVPYVGCGLLRDPLV